MVMLGSCAAPEAPGAAEPSGEPGDARAAEAGEDAPDADSDSDSDAPQAAVTAIRATGSPGSYTLAVTVESDESGCERYADWWEVLRADETLVYRRILAHSHVDEQPFTRSGGPISLAPDDVVVVRAHLRPAGVDAPGVYRGRALRGSVREGFVAYVPPEGFGAALEDAPPQPSGCAF